MMLDKKTLPVLGLLTLSMVFFILLLNLKAVAFDVDFYEAEFKKYSPEIEDPMEITRGLLFYLKHGEADESHISEFDIEEQVHLAEVKQRFQTMFIILDISIFVVILLLILLYRLSKEKFLENMILFFMLKGVGMLLAGLFFVYASMFFENTFSRFHQVLLFGNWQFSAQSKLITLFPAQFFADIVQKLLQNTFAIAGLLIGISLVLYMIKKKHLD